MIPLLAQPDPTFPPILRGWNTNTPAEVADVLARRLTMLVSRINERLAFEAWLLVPGNVERLRQALRDRRRLCQRSRP
jgi:hypothetical protein